MIDITIGYPERDPLSFPGMMAGIYQPRHIHVHSRAYPITDIPQDPDRLQSWLYERYTEKEELLKHFYTNKKSMNIADQQERQLPRLHQHIVTVDMAELVFIHIFYLVSSYVFWHIFYLPLFTCISLMISILTT